MRNKGILLGEYDLVLGDDSFLELICCERFHIIDLFWNHVDRLLVELVSVDLVCKLALLD